MCFIKKVYKPVEYKHSLFPTSCDLQSLEMAIDQSETKKSQNSKQQEGFEKDLSQNESQRLFLNLLSQGLQRNSHAIDLINKQIWQCQEKIDNLEFQWKDSQNNCIEFQGHQKQNYSQAFLSDDQTSMKQEFSENMLTNKLFGERKYQYKLSLEENFPSVIYKERNIKVKLSLKNLNGKIIKNSNVMNLCFALADDNGNWINVNRVGDPMLKGKTEVELYHGEAEFNKIYTKDISRTFPNGRVNIVIYPKPSVLIYHGLTSEYEEHIDELSVEPLIISELVIKAKKKY